MSTNNRSSRSNSSRRDLIRAGLGLAAVSAVNLQWPGALPRTLAEEDAALPGFGQAKQIVFLYMNGGASHLETFDPKPGTSTGGPTRTIPTAVTGVHIADSLPLLAKRMNDVCVIRGMSSKEGNHERARYLMHTAYPPTPTIKHAAFGSLLAHEVGNPDAELPEYIAINGPGARPGYLGAGYAPFLVRVRGEDPNVRGGGANNRRRKGGDKSIVSNLKQPGGMSKERRDRRLAMLSSLNEDFARPRHEGVSAAQAAMFERARRLMDSPKNTAFDMESESAETRARYGKSSFGQGCMLARRLIDQGVKCVEVMSNGWDTHDDNFNRVKALNAGVDQGASALIDDLKKSGRLDQTLIVWLGDFGRTPRITASQGRGHYPRAWSTFMTGGGVQGGRVIGATDAKGETVVNGKVSVPDFFASIAHATGMDVDKTFHSNGRPITIVKDGAPLPDLFKA